MMNHALFGGLLQADAIPITDEPFHNRALARKLQRAAQEPPIQQAISDRIAQHRLKADILTTVALTDSQITLPILNTEVPLDEMLEYRRHHPEALAEVRDTLGIMARRIQSEPWSEDFAREIDTKTLPDLMEQLEKARKARDSWLSNRRTKRWLEAAGITVGAASAVLSVFTAPITPVALAAAGLGLASGSVIPGVKWLTEWLTGKKSIQENGLHYLLKT